MRLCYCVQSHILQFPLFVVRSFVCSKASGPLPAPLFLHDHAPFSTYSYTFPVSLFVSATFCLPQSMQLCACRECQKCMWACPCRCLRTCLRYQTHRLLHSSTKAKFAIHLQTCIVTVSLENPLSGWMCCETKARRSSRGSPSLWLPLLCSEISNNSFKNGNC